jgi:hypothetical protein
VTHAQALAFVASHGLVLESGSGPVPSLAATVAGETIRGSWWAHERAREIFALSRALRSSPDVLVCRLIDGKITYVHRRLWPALVRLESRFARAHLARLHEAHNRSGKHTLEEIGFPGWVSPLVAAQAARLDEATALAELGHCCKTIPRGRKSARRARAPKG